MILTDVSDTIHADSLALFALNIEILLADVTKPEKSKILILTWPVTSSVISGSNFWPCSGSSRTGLSNGVWNLEIGPVVWEISGGGPLAPPPQQERVTIQTPAGRGLTFGNKVHLAKMCAEPVVSLFVDVSLMHENGIGGRDVRFFGVKSRTTQITPRWGYLSIPWLSRQIRLCYPRIAKFVHKCDWRG